jgi:hypothetical protein
MPTDLPEIKNRPTILDPKRNNMIKEREKEESKWEKRYPHGRKPWNFFINIMRPTAFESMPIR